LLGEGGGGTVYEGLHKGLGIPVAVKVIREGLRGESIRKALRAEARLLAHLGHPNIVRVYDFDDDGDEPFLVMELVAGQSLTELYRQVGALRPEFAAGAIAQAARGLDAARAVGVIHRDVKPSNILIAKSGAVKIADLGLAVASNVQLQAECGVNGIKDAGTGGTFAYMAPERFSGRGPVEFYSDLYSLGVSFFEVVTGRLPYSGATPFEFMVAHASNEIPIAHDLNPAVPPEMSRVIARMMAKEPHDRYTNYPELIAELIRICKPLLPDEGCSTWNSMWDGLTIEISGVVSGSKLGRR
jgi:serine/threonine protein kinase